MSRPWDHLLSEGEKRVYTGAGFGNQTAIGRRPALLIIDVQYRTAGTRSMPIDEAMREFPTSCGEVAWQAVPRIAMLLELFRRKGWPVIYPHVAPKNAEERGRLAEKTPSMWTIPPEGYDFVAEVAPVPGDILVPKRHPSSFFGTALVSNLIEHEADTLVVTGCSTSGCVRSSVVDAFSYNYRVFVAEDGVYDRSPSSHAMSLFDMNQKYAEVLPAAKLAERLEALKTEETV